MDIDYAYIAVTGPIASGKSVLAADIANRWGFTPIIESWDKRVLQLFYEDRSIHGVATQYHFGARRHEALSAITEGTGLWVSDFVFGVDGAVYAPNLMAEGNMTRTQLREFRAMETILAGMAPKPTLFVNLEASVDVLQQRIAMRNRPVEAGLRDSDGAKYLEGLSELHRKMYAAHEGRKCTILTDRLNLVPNFNRGHPEANHIDEVLGFILMCMHELSETGEAEYTMRLR